MIFLSRSMVYEFGSERSFVVEGGFPSVFVDECLLDLMAQRRATGFVGEALNCLLDGDSQPHRLLDLLGAAPGMVRPAFESVVEAVEDVVGLADPDADGLAAAAVVSHAPSQTCKGLKSSERVQTMDETPLREQVKVGQGFAREQRRRGFGGPGCVDCGVVPAPAWKMIGTAAARLRLCSECRMHREIAERREKSDE